MTTLDQIKSLMKSGDIAGAEALCREALAADPDNAEIKMRYGLCRQLQGDEETFRAFHPRCMAELGGACRRPHLGASLRFLLSVSLIMNVASYGTGLLLGHPWEPHTAWSISEMWYNNFAGCLIPNDCHFST